MAPRRQSGVSLSTPAAAGFLATHAAAFHEAVFHKAVFHKAGV
jgi:hypothetical protein